MERRNVLRLMAGAGVAAVLPTGVWRDIAQAFGTPAVPGLGPYGPLQAPDANGFRLPAGFTSRELAVTGQPVPGTSFLWHGAPDGGGVVPTGDGGWIYVSNAEISSQGGGASAIRFDSNANIVDAYSVLTGTSWNCAGGVTPWNTWLSCEEAGSGGEVWECDPYRPSQGVARPALGRFNHEAAAVDPATGHVYLTEDKPDGRFYRFEPTTPGDLTAGALFAASVGPDDVVSWVPSSAAGPDRQATTTPFNGGEGVYLGDGVIWFATKGDNRVWELELATSRLAVAYDCNAHPDGELLDVDNVVVHGPSGRVFVAEDLGNMELGVLSGPPEARTVSIAVRVDGQSGSELAGMAFSPDGTRMYLSSQRGTGGGIGRTYEITGPWAADSPSPPPPPRPPAEETSTVDQMAWVRGGSYAGSVMGAGDNQQICFNGTATYSRRTFMSFPVDAAAGSFERATLRMSARVWTGGGELAVEPVAGGWQADTLTWNTQPSPTGAIVGSGPLTSERAEFEFDVTDHLNAIAANGGTSASFGVRQSRRNGPLGYVSGPAQAGAPTLTVVRSDSPPPPPLITTNVSISADSWIRGGTFADVNNANSRLMQVCNNGNEQYTRWALLGADVPALAGAVQRATLRVNARMSSGSNVAHEVVGVAGAWDASTVTWNTRPVAEGVALSQFQIVDTSAQWYDLDVTPAVAALAGAPGRVSFAIRQVQRNGPVAYVNPTNHWTPDVPELVVEHG